MPPLPDPGRCRRAGRESLRRVRPGRAARRHPRDDRSPCRRPRFPWPGPARAPTAAGASIAGVRWPDEVVGRAVARSTPVAHRPLAPRRVPSRIDQGRCRAPPCRRRMRSNLSLSGRAPRRPGPGRAIVDRCPASRPPRPPAARRPARVDRWRPCGLRPPTAGESPALLFPCGSPDGGQPRLAFASLFASSGRSSGTEPSQVVRSSKFGDVDDQVLLDQLVTEGDPQRLQPPAGLVIGADAVRADQEDQVRDGRRTVRRLRLLDVQHLPGDRQHDRAGSRVDQRRELQHREGLAAAAGASPRCPSTPGRSAAARCHWAPCRAGRSIPTAGSPW